MVSYREANISKPRKYLLYLLKTLSSQSCEFPKKGFSNGLERMYASVSQPFLDGVFRSLKLLAASYYKRVDLLQIKIFEHQVFTQREYLNSYKTSSRCGASAVAASPFGKGSTFHLMVKYRHKV